MYMLWLWRRRPPGNVDSIFSSSTSNSACRRNKRDHAAHRAVGKESRAELRELRGVKLEMHFGEVGTGTQALPGAERASSVARGLSGQAVHQGR